MNNARSTIRKMTLGMLVGGVLASSFVLLPQEVRAQSTGSTAGTVAGGAAGGLVSCGSLLASRTAGDAAGAGGGSLVGLAGFATGLPVYDYANLVGQVAVSNGQGTQDVWKCVVDNLAWTLGKIAVQSITRSTVNWINSGFSGSPAFVTDLQQNLNVLSDTVANNFFQQLNNEVVATTGFNLTSPFQDQLTQQLRANYYKQTGSLLGGNQYNLFNQSSNPQAFLGGDFTQGGFNAFFSANSNPANNPFGAYQLASNALWTQIGAASQQRKLEYQVGKGFLSWRGDCSAQQAVTDISGLDANGLPANSTVPATSLSPSEPCYGSPIKTPGSVIEAQLEQQLGSGVQQLNLADSMNEIVSALVSQLVNQVLGSGGLTGLSQPAAGGGTSYIDQTTSESQYSSQFSNMTDGLTQTITADIAALTTYRNDWQKILDAANNAQQACGATPEISRVLTQATAGVAQANTAIQQETALKNSIQSIASSDPTQVTTIIAQYQSYLGSKTTPTSTDESFAAAQSSETSGTLYSQMVEEKSTCQT